jgi:WD40 repeat protein
MTSPVGMCNRVAVSDAVQVEYRSGGPADPGGHFALTVHADGKARLEQRQLTGERAWTARLEPAVWARLLDALDRSGFPAVRTRPIPPGPAPRELAVDPLGELVVGWHDTSNEALTEVFQILDALVRQVSGGAVRSTVDELPQVAHWSAPDTSLSEPEIAASGAAAFGTIAERPVCVIARSDVSILSVPDGEPLGSFVLSRQATRAIALGAAGERDLLATAGDDHVIEVRDARTAETLHSRTGHRGPVAGVAALQVEGKPMVLSAGADGDVRFWPGQAADDLEAVSGRKGGFTSLCHARVRDRDLVCAGGDDGIVRVWNVADGAPVDELRDAHAGWVNAVAMTEVDGRGLVASGGADQSVRIWDLTSGTERHTLTGHTDSVTGLAFTTVEGRTVIGSCSLDGTVRTWDAVTGEALADWSAESGWQTTIAAVRHGDRPALVTGGADGALRLWDAATGAPLATIAGESAVSALAAASADGTPTIAAGYKDGSLRLWTGGTLTATIPPSDGAITAVALGPGELVCGTDTGTVRVHDVATGGELRVPTPHAAPVLSMAFAGDVLVSSGADAIVRTWDASSGAPLSRLLGHTAGVAAVTAGQVGGRTVIASGGYDRVVRTWDAVTGRPLLAIHGHMYPVYAVALGEGLLASASYDGVVRVCDAATGDQVALLPGNDGPVRAMSFAGHDLAVATEDGAVRLWRLPAGELVEESKVAQTPLAVAFSEGHIHTAGMQGLMRL